MKTLVKLFFLVAVISLVAGCNKTDEFFEDTQPELKKAKMKVMPSTSTDLPVKAEEDWNSINDALQNAGPGEDFWTTDSAAQTKVQVESYTAQRV